MRRAGGPTGRRLPRRRRRLRESLWLASRAGIDPTQVTVDPGIGSTVNAEMSAADWNLAILRDLDELRRLGRPILIAVSRKGFIGRILNQPDPSDRLNG